MDWQGRQVAVVGFGVSNQALTRYLLKKGARVTVLDKKDASEMDDALQRLGQGVSHRFGPGYLDDLGGYDTVFLTPGMPKDLPQIEEARDRGVAISSETRLFLSLCRAQVVGITGSAGKTTTTTLTGAILENTGARVFVGGNIGTPLIELVEDIPADAFVVMEMSSFQLELVDKSPGIAALLNLSPDHLNIHGSLDRYYEAKRNVYRYQKKGDVAVFNADRENTREMATTAPGRVAWFSSSTPVETGAYATGGAIYLKLGDEKRVCGTDELGIKGRHNLENALAALVCAGLAGAPAGAAEKVFREFRGVEHRLELVREAGGVKYYNDSIATAPERSLAALETLDPPIILIAGGYDKGVPFDGLASAILGRVRLLVTLGKAAPKIEQALRQALAGRDDGPQVIRCRDLTDAVEVARRLSEPGDTVLLSPACASYDMFSNYEERGRFFKALVSGAGE